MSRTDNHRKFIRLDIPLRADVRVQGPGPELVRGSVANLSLGGCFVECTSSPAASRQCRIDLYFEGHKSEMLIAADARIVRQEPSRGMGIEFDRLSAESSLHLQRLLFLNSGSETARVEAEMRGHRGPG